MGCVLSKQGETQNVILICRERKQRIKSTVENRKKLADSHCKYYHSLYAVSAAIKLFVARHSSPCSPFLISISPQNQICDPNPSLTHQQTPQIKPTQISNSSNFAVSTPQLDSPVFVEAREDRGWDFFINPFADMFTEHQINDFNDGFDDQLREIREREGIPELEEEDDEEEEEEEEKQGCQAGKMEDLSKNGVCEEMKTMSEWEKDSFRMIEADKNGRELFDALKDVEDHFIRAYESGIQVSEFLEVNVADIQSSIDGIKECSNKLIESKKLHQSTYKSSSRKSFLVSASINSSSLIEYKNDIFHDDEALKPDSHKLTLERIFEWEKKLYQEVKNGDDIRKTYAKKCAQLGSHEATEDSLGLLDSASEEVKDLYTEILVAIRRAEKVAEKIQILRDEELQPQILKLLHGLMQTWKIMSESHESQRKAMLEVKSFDLPTYGKYSNDSHRIATLQLEAELQNWRVCFVEYVSSQKAYIKSLNGWLSMFKPPKAEESFTITRKLKATATLIEICQKWSSSLEELPEVAVKATMKKFGKQIRKLWIQQGDEQQQKRKVEGVTKELDKKVTTFHREESMLPASKILDKKTQSTMQNRVEYMTQKKKMLELYRKKVDAEKARHHISMQETQRMTWNCFKTGFSSVFESLHEFSVTSVNIYSDLVSRVENADAMMISDGSRK